MTDEAVPERRNLLGGLRARAEKPEIEIETIKAAAEKNGFSPKVVDDPAVEPASPVPVVVATQVEVGQGIEIGRKREASQRNQPFTTRLTAKNKSEIYDYANAKNIPVAQVIEEAMAALLAAKAN